MKKKLIFEGAATALITPFLDGKIDYPALDKIIEMQIRAGIPALVIGGTTGEAATLGTAERYELFAHVKEAVHGRAKLIFGTGTNDTRLAIRHTEAAERIGCDGVLVVTPYYNKGTRAGIVEHYKAIAAISGVPMILYNVPSRTGVNLSLSQLEELAKIKSIVAIKEAGDSVDRLTELSAFGDELYLYAGNDSQIYATAALGGKGVISVISNLYPAFVEKIYTHFVAGRAHDALTMQRGMLALIKLLFSDTNPSPIKYAMSLRKYCTAELRLPLLPPENATRMALSEAMRELEAEFGL